MTQTELERAIAAATGESLREIQRRGFTLVLPGAAIATTSLDPWLRPQQIDWDAADGSIGRINRLSRMRNRQGR